MYSIKYPRTPHLPGSPAYSSDDELMISLQYILESKEDIVITEKMDGENTTLYSDHYHARSINNDPKKHPSRDWIKNYWSDFAYEIPEGYRICGENLYAQHSIPYDNLPSYFLGFSVWNEENICLKWNETINFFARFNIHSVPVLYRGKFDWAIITNIANSLDPEKQEGFILRTAGEFAYNEFSHYVGKWVRKESDVNSEPKRQWFNMMVVKNRMKEP